MAKGDKKLQAAMSDDDVPKDEALEATLSPNGESPQVVESSPQKPTPSPKRKAIRRKTGATAAGAGSTQDLGKAGAGGGGGQKAERPRAARGKQGAKGGRGGGALPAGEGPARNTAHEASLEKFRYWLKKSPHEIQQKYRKACKHEQSSWRKQWEQNKNFEFVGKSKTISKSKGSQEEKSGTYLNEDRDLIGA